MTLSLLVGTFFTSVSTGLLRVRLFVFLESNCSFRCAWDRSVWVASILSGRFLVLVATLLEGDSSRLLEFRGLNVGCTSSVSLCRLASGADGDENLLPTLDAPSAWN